MAKISVIVPVYNAEAYLRRCLDSLVHQTYRDFEIILVNDGSTDGTGDICREYEGKFNHIMVIHKANGGSASARNAGLSAAGGEYLAFVDADDYVEKAYLENMIHLSVNHDADLVVCAYEEKDGMDGQDVRGVSDEGVKRKAEMEIQQFNNIEMLEYFCTKRGYLQSAVLWNKLYRRELFDGLRFVEGKGIDDEYLIHEVLYRSRKTIVTNEVLYYYVLTSGSQMRSGFSPKRLDSLDALERQLAFFRKINQPHLYNMLLYRYYSYVFYSYYMMTKHFGDETALLRELKKKRKRLYQALLAKEIPFRDKIFLLKKRYIPARVFK